jgi:hypothetical protein
MLHHIVQCMVDIACMRRRKDGEQWLDYGLGCLTILPYYSFTYFPLLPPARSSALSSHASEEKLPPDDPGSGENGESSLPKGNFCIH